VGREELMTGLPNPSLAELVADPGKLSALPPEAIPEFRGELARIDSLLLARLVAPNVNGSGHATQSTDRLLTVKEAAVKLNTSEDWLYRNWRMLPFALPFGRRGVRFSERAIDENIKKKVRLK
jgi:predicted DNA-binding transcriptional regulator AlpA